MIIGEVVIMKELAQLVGYIGSILLIICGLPQLFHTLKTKEVDDLSLSFFVMWFVGCLCMLFYVCYDDDIIEIPLIFDYVMSSIIAIWISFLVIKYRKK